MTDFTPTDAIPLDDRGLLLGDGLFETVLWRDGRLVLWDRHVARMQAGAATLGLSAPGGSEMLTAAQDAVLAQGLSGQRAAVRLTLTAGSGGRGLDRPERGSSRLFATAAMSPRPEGPVSLATARTRRNEQSPASRLKALAYLDNVLARREAAAAGAEEAVMLNTQGQVACAAAANLFWIEGGRLFTPALECGVLDGILRQAVIDRAGDCGPPVEEVVAAASALDTAEAVFITNSLAGIRAAVGLDGRAFAPHPMIAILQLAIADLT